jgi:hypothetical protein
LQAVFSDRLVAESPIAFAPLNRAQADSSVIVLGRQAQDKLSEPQNFA